MKERRLFIATGVIVLILLLSSIPSVVSYSIDIRNQNDNPLNSGILEQLALDTVGKSGTDWYYKPSSYAELVGWYQNLESLYPEYLEVFKANELYGTGTVTGGYDLYYVRITNESLGLHKPEALFLGSPHGDETVGTVGLYWFTDWLMRMAFTDEPCQEYSKEWIRWLIDNREIYIEISHNPCGFDRIQRRDANGWDLNREADYDGPGSPTGGIWGSVNGKTLRAFIDNHVVRTGCDFHGGVRLLLYSWASNHDDIYGTSPITGKTYSHAPPDFYYFDVSSLRLGDYMGDYGGNLDKNSIGTIPDTVGYEAPGGICPWAYGADVVENPVEDPFVEDETFGNYPGAGILWISPEISSTKNPSESTFGNDTVHRYGAEVRRFVLHQMDLAQPYARWMYGTVEDNSWVLTNTEIDFRWQVNGSLVVDHTYIQWGTDPNPIENWEYTTSDYDAHDGDYLGGTGWDDAESGQTNSVTYIEKIMMDMGGEYYFVAKAQVDQVYKDVLQPDVYGNNPYLRLMKERTNGSYYEMLNGTDGVEEIVGQTWWYSPIIHVTVNSPPEKPEKPSGPNSGKTGMTYLFSTSAVDPNDNQIYYMWDWGDGNVSDWIGPYNSGETASASHQWSEKWKKCSIQVKAKDVYGEESSWSDPFSIIMPRNHRMFSLFFDIIEQSFPRLFSIIDNIMNC